MKTLKVRPVLVETKENTGITLGINITRNIPGAMRGQNYELILISLEDEKIEDYTTEFVLLGEWSGRILTMSRTGSGASTIYINHPHNNGEKIELYMAGKKVIARQSQISPEYISKFIEQYNNGCVEDLDIEMEDRFGYCNKCNAYQYAFHISCSYIFCDGLVIQKTEPQLTNGFVTIVEKEQILYTQEQVDEMLDRQAAITADQMLLKFKNYYSEEEVKVILNVFARDLYYQVFTNKAAFQSDFIRFTREWFEANKKK